MSRTNRNRATVRMAGQIVREHIYDVTVMRLIRPQVRNHVASAPNRTIRFQPGPAEDGPTVLRLNPIVPANTTNDPKAEITLFWFSHFQLRSAHIKPQSRFVLFIADLA